MESVSPELAVNVLKRLTGLRSIVLDEPVRDIQRFLDFLDNFDNVFHLEFYTDQHQDLIDRLSSYDSIQLLTIGPTVDFEFLFRLKSLTYLNLDFPIHADLIPKVLEGLPFLSKFRFKYSNKLFIMRIGGLEEIHVLFYCDADQFKTEQCSKFSDVSSAIQFIQTCQF